jgi:hypothetical protein
MWVVEPALIEHFRMIGSIFCLQLSMYRFKIVEVGFTFNINSFYRFDGSRGNDQGSRHISDAGVDKRMLGNSAEALPPSGSFIRMF